MVQNILKPMSSSNYGTPAVEAGNLPVQPYNTAADETPDVATITTVTASTSSTVVLAANIQRQSAIFYNASTAICYLAFGSTASPTAYSVQIAANGNYTLSVPIYTGEISAVWVSANGELVVTTY